MSNKIEIIIGDEIFYYSYEEWLEQEARTQFNNALKEAFNKINKNEK